MTGPNMSVCFFVFVRTQQNQLNFCVFCYISALIGVLVNALAGSSSGELVGALVDALFDAFFFIITVFF